MFITPSRITSLLSDAELLQQPQTSVLLTELLLMDSGREWSEITQPADSEQLFVRCQNVEEL